MAIATIDYSSIKKDLAEQARSFMLSQYNYTISPVLDSLLQVYISEIQELYDAIVALMEYRSIAKAKGIALDEIGHIVGRDRIIYNYDAAFWFAPDADGVQPDNGHWWCKNAVQAVSETMDDETYRKWIWMQILENHNLFSSVPELENAIYDGIGEIVGIEKDGVMSAKLYVQSQISLTNKSLLSYNKDTELTDNDYLFAYPAPTSITEIEEV